MSTLSVLYITYDAISGHIGQSQVAPYLLGLATKGHRITLISAEKPGNTKLVRRYEELFRNADIDWHYVWYHKNPPIASSLWDLYRMQRLASRLILRNKVTVIHCRSYVASLIGLHFKKKTGIKLIFDMRDFWADHCRETKRFDVDNNRIHRAIFNFFKRKEKEFLEQSDQIISLTEVGKRVMQDWSRSGAVKITAPISVIPCCADFSFFDPARIEPGRKAEMGRALGLESGDFVLNYLGSLSPPKQIPTDMIDEMLDFFMALLERRPEAKFLIVANDRHYVAHEAARQRGVNPEKLIVVSATREEVPYLLSLSSMTVFFYTPFPALRASSPTKLAEFLAMNVPVIGNTCIGDLDAILAPDVNCSTVVTQFNKEEYLRAIDCILHSIETKHVPIRDNSNSFSLTTGVRAYNDIYNRLKNS